MSLDLRIKAIIDTSGIKLSIAKIKDDLDGLRAQVAKPVKSPFVGIESSAANLKTTYKGLIAEQALLNKSFNSGKINLIEYNNRSKLVSTNLRSVGLAAKNAGIEVQGLNTKVSSSSNSFRTFLSTLRQFASFVVIGGTLKVLNDTLFGLDETLVSISKTTGFAGDDLNDLKNELLDISKVTPVSALALGEIATVAGQLGLGELGVEGLAAFTENIAQATTIFPEFAGGAEEVATLLAKVSNVFGLTDDELQRYISSLNELSNTTAANASEISQFQRNFSGTANQFDITAENAAALGATLISLGDRGDDAGTRLSSGLFKAAESASNFSEQLGLTKESIQGAFERDGLEAINLIVQGLESIETNAERVSVATDIFGVVGARSILKLVGNLDQLNDNIGVSGQAFLDNVSAANEFEKASNSLNGELQKTSSVLFGAAQSVTNSFKPALIDLLRLFRGEGSGAINAFAGALAGIGIVKAISGLSSLGVALGVLKRQITATGVAISLNPIGLLVSGVGLLSGVLVGAQASIRAFNEQLDDTIESSRKLSAGASLISDSIADSVVEGTREIESLTDEYEKNAERRIELIKEVEEERGEAIENEIAMDSDKLAELIQNDISEIESETGNINEISQLRSDLTDAIIAGDATKAKNAALQLQKRLNAENLTKAETLKLKKDELERIDRADTVLQNAISKRRRELISETISQIQDLENAVALLEDRQAKSISTGAKALLTTFSANIAEAITPNGTGIDDFFRSVAESNAETVKQAAAAGDEYARLQGNVEGVLEEQIKLLGVQENISAQAASGELLPQEASLIQEVFSEQGLRAGSAFVEVYNNELAERLGVDVSEIGLVRGDNPEFLEGIRREISQEFIDARKETDLLGLSLEDLVSKGLTLKNASDSIGDEVIIPKNLGGSVKKATDSVEELDKAARKLILKEALEKSKDEAKDFTDAIKESEKATKNLEKAVGDLDDELGGIADKARKSFNETIEDGAKDATLSIADLKSELVDLDKSILSETDSDRVTELQSERAELAREITEAEGEFQKLLALVPEGQKASLDALIQQAEADAQLSDLGRKIREQIREAELSRDTADLADTLRDFGSDDQAIENAKQLRDTINDIDQIAIIDNFIAESTNIQALAELKIAADAKVNKEQEESLLALQEIGMQNVGVLEDGYTRILDIFNEVLERQLQIEASTDRTIQSASEYGFNFNPATGRLESFHTGGLISGASNDKLINAQGGEFVLQRSAVRSLGLPTLKQLNNGLIPQNISKDTTTNMSRVVHRTIKGNVIINQPINSFDDFFSGYKRKSGRR